MTQKQARRIYAEIADNFDDAPDAITRELTAVVAATSCLKGADAIKWWDCWPSLNGDETAVDTSRRIRKLCREAKQ